MVIQASQLITADDAVMLIAKLIGFAVFLQSLELLLIHRQYREESGIWQWSIIRDEFKIFPEAIQWVLDRLLGFKGFVSLLSVRTLAAGSVLILPWSHLSIVLPAILLISTLLICLRWRGTFNGGSDSMTVIVLSALTVTKFAPENLKLTQACLWYIAIQCCFSYLFAGWAKLKNADWRSGSILGYIGELPDYGTPESLKPLFKRFGLLLSWSIIVFECCFPLTLLDSRLFLICVPIALLFHLGNVYAFGLNRFLFTWTAAYPALLYCSRPC